MRKPSKADYADPKAYRPIALLNTIGKALEAAIATCISYMVEVYSLLPQTHVGGHSLTEGNHVSMLFISCWNKSMHPGVSVLAHWW